MWDSLSLSFLLPRCLSLSVCPSVCLLLSLRDKLLQNHKRLKKITEGEEKRDFSQEGFPLPKQSQHAPAYWDVGLCVSGVLWVFLWLCLSFCACIFGCTTYVFTAFVCSHQLDLTGKVTLICTKNKCLICTKTEANRVGSTRVFYVSETMNKTLSILIQNDINQNIWIQV